MCRWLQVLPALLATQLVVVDLPRPLELGQETAEIVLIASDDADELERVSATAADPTENLILRLEEVEVDEDPDVSWEVYVASSDEADCTNVPELAGILSLYGAPPSAEFVFPLDAAVVAGEPVGLRIIFRPASGLEVEGAPVPPTVRMPVRIGAISLETERVVSAD